MFGAGVNFHEFFKRGAKVPAGLGVRSQYSLQEPPSHHDGDVNDSQATEKQPSAFQGQLPPLNSTIITHSSALHTA